MAEYEAAREVAKQVDELQNIALLMARTGRPADATPYLDAALRICELHGDRFERFYVLCTYGNILGLLARHEEALAALRTSLAETPVLSATGVANVVEIMAWCHAATGEEHRAAVLLGSRGRVWADVGYQPGFYLKDGYAAMEKQLATSLGDPAFRAAYDEGFAMPLEAAVQFALGQEAQASTPRPTTGQDLGGSILSKRERQVAALVARGLSNKDIAEELVISMRTAEGHVARIMDKLAVSSRAGVAGWVTAEGSGGRE